MDKSRWQRVEELFHQAVELEPDKLETFLESATEDSDLRAEVRSLVMSDGDDKTLLQNAVHEAAPGPSQHQIGRHIGPYRLLKVLGTGGMGTVFLAERDDDEFQQRVAIKVTRSEVLGSEVAARFLVERQILASLDHPNIARLLDGGTSATGLPYVVMEYLEGQPIDTYCSQRRLELRQRIELMAKICDAVQYAHEKLIIHRDLKPSNILITASGTPKLLDFGIAKLLDPQASASHALETVGGVRPLTPEYASPEQLRGESMNTASDVYSLGVLLFELLTGRRPTPANTRDPLKIESALRARELPLPSATVSSPSTDLALAFPQMAPDAGFSETPEKRADLLRGELDTIVIKALQFDPDRRYGTASQLAADLRNYLEDRPISARPDTWSYRALKFTRRNRGSVTAAIIAVVLLTALAITSSVMAVRLRTERDSVIEEKQRANEMLGFLTDLFKDTTPSASQGRELTASELLERGTQRLSTMSDDPLLQSALGSTLGTVHLERGDFESSRELFEQALVQAKAAGNELATATVKADYALTAFELGDTALAEDLVRDAIEIFMGRPDQELNELGAKETLATILDGQERYDEAQALLEEILARQEELGENSHYTYNNLAQVEQDRGNYERAVELQRRSIELGDQVLKRPHALVATRLSNLASSLSDLGRFAEAETLYIEALEMQKELYPDLQHPDLAATYNNLGVLQNDLERYEEALESLQAARRITEAAYGPDHGDLASIFNNLNLPLRQLGRTKDSERALLRAIEISEINEGPESLGSAIYKNNLARFYESVENLPRARRLQIESIDILRKNFGEDHPYVGTALSNLASIESNAGDLEAAERLGLEALGVQLRLEAAAPSTAIIRYNLGKTLAARGKLDEALEMMRKSYSDFSEFQDISHSQRGRAALRLGELLLRLDQTESSLSLLEEADGALAEGAAREELRDDVLVALALARARSGRLAEAQALLATADRNNPPTSVLLSAARDAVASPGAGR